MDSPRRQLLAVLEAEEVAMAAGTMERQAVPAFLEGELNFLKKICRKELAGKPEWFFGHKIDELFF